MELNIRSLNNEVDELILFLTRNRWEFHPAIQPSQQEIAALFEKGWYQNDRESFWIEYGT